MAARTVRRPSNMINDWLTQYLTLGNEEKRIKARRADVRKNLINIVENNHVVDGEKGHLIYNLDEPIETLDGNYLGFMKQRKVSQIFDEDKALELCESLDLDIDDYTSRYIDQEKIVRLYADGALTDDQFNSLHENTISWAFVPVKE